MRYAFGDSDLAARRLRLLGEVFAPSTRAFLQASVSREPSLVVDLGCGPGYTTHFLAETLPCERAVGLDHSDHFISLAQQTATQRVSFQVHDVTQVPFPTGPADLLYCRFLLTHLRDPEAVVARWTDQLRPGGLLLMEEAEWIQTENLVFQTYLQIVEALLAAQSNTLYVGPALDRLASPGRARKRQSQIGWSPAATGRAATMFSLNIQSWKHHPLIQASYAPDLIRRLEEDLKALSSEPDSEVAIEFGLRQLVFERP
jgi:trans-aconitate 2-methyltransferase